MINNLSVYDFDGTMIKFPENYNWTGDEFNWDNFIRDMQGAEPIKEVVEQFCLDLQSKTVTPIIVTARPITYIRETMNKLMEICGYPLFKDIPIIARPDYMVEDETRALNALDRDATEEMVKKVIHEHHKVYRETVVQSIQENEQLVDRVYDDQAPNLEAYLPVCGELMLVDGDNVTRWLNIKD